MNFQAIKFEKEEANLNNGSTFFAGNSEQKVKITRAEFVKSTRTGAQGIEFDVINNQKQKGYFTIWHLLGNGDKNPYSYKLLQALMGACGVENLTPTTIKVKKYIPAMREECVVDCTNAKELIGKIFVGLFVDIYSIYNGEEKVKTELFAPFNPNRQSYREACAGDDAQDIEKALEAMLNKSMKSKEKAQKELSPSSAPPTTAHQASDFSDEDIPF